MNLLCPVSEAESSKLKETTSDDTTILHADQPFFAAHDLIAVASMHLLLVCRTDFAMMIFVIMTDTLGHSYRPVFEEKGFVLATTTPFHVACETS